MDVVTMAKTRVKGTNQYYRYEGGPTEVRKEESGGFGIYDISNNAQVGWKKQRENAEHLKKKIENGQPFWGW